MACTVLLSALAQAQNTRPAKRDTVKAKRDTATRLLKEVNITSKYYRKYKLDKSSSSLKVTTPVLNCSHKISRR